MSANTPAQSGREAAIARRKAQVSGKGGSTRVVEVAPVVVAQAAPIAKSVAVAEPSRPKRQVTVAPVEVAAGREAAKTRRQQQTKGRVASSTSKPTTQSRGKAKEKQTDLPPIEPRQASAEKSTPRSEKRSVVANNGVSQSGGRLLSKAYRQAQAKGKAGQTAFKTGTSQSGAKAKLANPEASTREIAKQIRSERCTKGKACSPAQSASRVRQERKQSQSVPQKVGESETLSGQTVSGTLVGQGNKRLTGAESGACQLVTGVEYLGAEEFATSCGSKPDAKPAKVGRTQTARGQSVSGTEVGLSQKMTGNEPGQCSSITGTEYLPADQSQMFCGAASAISTARSFSVKSSVQNQSGSKVTGGDSRKSQSTTIKPKESAAPQKVVMSKTAEGNETTGTQVGRLQPVTGVEKGNCKAVTGTGYQSSEEAQELCQMPAVKTATKVTASGTRGGQKVTGDRSSGFSNMTGGDAGNCQALTGTPYTGTEMTTVCSVDRQAEVKQRQPKGINPSITGVQPGPEGLTGAQKGACSLVTGVYYQGSDQMAMVCDTTNSARPGESDFPMMIGQAPAGLVNTPVQVPMEAEESIITGNGWNKGSKVTGTEGLWASKRNATIRGTSRQAPMGANQFNPAAMAEVPISPITGSSGNTETGAKVTLSGGARA